MASTTATIAPLSQPTPQVRGPAANSVTDKNVAALERWASLLGGGTMAAVGLARGGVAGVTAALVGGSLIHRGVTGNCMVYSALGVNTARAKDGQPIRIGAGRGAKVVQSVTVMRPQNELFRFWRDFSNLPQVMTHLRSVSVISDTRSHWVASAPFGKVVEWDAEVYTERDNELIGWRSLAGSQVDTAGSVLFRPAPGNRGTEVTVTLKYDPPAGKLGVAIAQLFGRSADSQVKDDLRRFKQIMEAGEAPTIAGQPHGKCA
jgi:uncharacterized membrane protein